MPSRESNALFQFLAEVNQGLIEFSIQLRRSSSLSNIRSGVDLRQYQHTDSINRKRAEICFEAYVEGDGDPGLSLCWWFELALRDDAWVLGRRILKDAPEGQGTLHELPDCLFQDVSQFVTQSSHLVQGLIGLAKVQELTRAVRNA